MVLCSGDKFDPEGGSMDQRLRFGVFLAPFHPVDEKPDRTARGPA
jgi:hypothetical protein